MQNLLTQNIKYYTLYVLHETQQKGAKIMNMNKLRAKIIEQGTNVKEVAISIGITGPTLYRKMKMPQKITIGEAIQIKDVLGLTDEEALEIFLFQTIASYANQEAIQIKELRYGDAIIHIRGNIDRKQVEDAAIRFFKKVEKHKKNKLKEKIQNGNHVKS